MKKIFVLLALVFLVTGCSVKEMPRDDLEKIVDNVLTSNVKLKNQYFAGYQYYLPREVTLIDKFDYNTILLHKNNKMYLYVDIISYYHKVEEKYEERDNIYFSKVLDYNGKTGYINVIEEDNNYYFEVVYNYGKIETYSNKENLTSTIINALYILRTLDFNDVVIDSLIGENKIEYKEEKFNLYKSDTDDDSVLNIVEKDEQYDGEEEKDDDILNDDNIKIKDDDELN